MDTLFGRWLEKQGPNVLVVGDVMCDQYIFGEVTRISPEAPVPVFETTEQRRTLGGAGNVAANLRALGCNVRLIGAIGADSEGSEVRSLLKQLGISDRWLVEDPSRPTTTKTRLIAHQQHVIRLDQERRAPLGDSLRPQVLQNAQTLIPEVDGVVCSDYDKGICTPELLRPLFAKACAMNRPIFVDPKKRDFTCYRGATVLTPNLVELERASNVSIDGPETLGEAVDVVLRQSQAAALLVTRGKDGLSLFTPPQKPIHIPTQARDVFDVTGAGDTVIAAFSMAMMMDASMVEAARIANVAAGVSVGKTGTAVVSLEELTITLRDLTNRPAQRLSYSSSS